MVFFKRFFGFSLILIVCILFCYPFFSNPLFFDDHYFFQPGNPEKVFADDVHFSPRWWVYETFAATYVLLGKKILWLRLGNLFFHMATAVALVALLRDLLRDLDDRVNSSISPNLTALLVGCLFVLHPLAIFTQGYLIQRTILAATFFSLLSLLAFWRGLSGSRLAMWGSCLFFILAVYAKEHAVMLPAAAGLLLLLHSRSGLSLGLPLSRVLALLMVQCGIALLVVLQLKGLIGTPYEPLAFEMLDGQVNIPVDRLYPLSVLNQGGLFFKYLGLWLVPVSTVVSVDIRQAFPLDFSNWQLWVGAVAYIVYLLGALALLMRGGARGLLGISLLVPGVLFFTEFSAVRLQESFVVYRSYLWMPFVFIGVALGLRRLKIKILLVILLLCMPFFATLSYLRLKTFSHPVLVWREAADVYEAGPQHSGVFGGYRIYYDLGCELQRFGYLQLALEAFDRALELKPGYGDAVSNKGAVFLDMKNYSAARVEFEMAVKLMPENFTSWNGLALAYEMGGDHAAAERARQASCALRNVVCKPEEINSDVLSR